MNCRILARWIPCLAAALLTGAVAARADSPIGFYEGRPEATWEDAGQLVGKVAVITGKIVDVHSTSRIHFLDFHKTDRSAFKVVIFEESIKNFAGDLAELYADRWVRVQGTVVNYSGNPQIVVTHPNQIEVVDSAEAVPQPAHGRPEPRPPVARDSFLLMAYNVRNLFDGEDNPYKDDQGTEAKPRAELEQIAAVIRKVNPDVLALEEVESRDYLQRFVDILLPDQGYQHVVHYEGNDRRGIDVSLVSRLPVGAVTSYRHLEFPGPGHEPMTFRRDLLRVEILPPGGDRFEVWVVHLKSKAGSGKNGGDGSEPIRLAEATQLRRLLDDVLAKDPAASFVLCGDFNDTLGSPSLDTILGSEPQRQLRSFFDEVPASARFTFNREPHREMIDFIFCSPAMAQRYVPHSYTIHTSTLEESGSDHNPVTARFTLRDSGKQGDLPDASRAGLIIPILVGLGVVAGIVYVAAKKRTKERI